MLYWKHWEVDGQYFSRCQSLCPVYPSCIEMLFDCSTWLLSSMQVGHTTVDFELLKFNNRSYCSHTANCFNCSEDEYAQWQPDWSKQWDTQLKYWLGMFHQWYMLYAIGQSTANILHFAIAYIVYLSRSRSRDKLQEAVKGKEQCHNAVWWWTIMGNVVSFSSDFIV